MGSINWEISLEPGKIKISSSYDYIRLYIIYTFLFILYNIIKINNNTPPLIPIIIGKLDESLPIRTHLFFTKWHLEVVLHSLLDIELHGFPIGGTLHIVSVIVVHLLSSPEEHFLHGVHGSVPVTDHVWSLIHDVRIDGGLGGTLHMVSVVVVHLLSSSEEHFVHGVHGSVPEPDHV